MIRTVTITLSADDGDDHLQATVTFDPVQKKGEHVDNMAFKHAASVIEHLRSKFNSETMTANIVRG